MKRVCGASHPVPDATARAHSTRELETLAKGFALLSLPAWMVRFFDAETGLVLSLSEVELTPEELFREMKSSSYIN